MKTKWYKEETLIMTLVIINTMGILFFAGIWYIDGKPGYEALWFNAFSVVVLGIGYLMRNSR